MFSTEREINTKKATRDGQKMGVHIINISRGTIGIGRPIRHTDTRELISGNLIRQIQATHCPITIPYWVLTGTKWSFGLVAPIIPIISHSSNWLLFFFKFSCICFSFYPHVIFNITLLLIKKHASIAN